ARPRRARADRRRRQPRRAADAGQGDVRAGQEVRRGVPQGPAAQGVDRDHPVQGQDLAAGRMTDMKTLPAPAVRSAQPYVRVRDLERDLARAVDGEVRFDPGSRGAYATDASNYRQVPIGVVVPRTVEA